MCAKLIQLCPALCDPRGYSPPGSSVHGILQATYWSGLPCPPPGDLPNPGIEPTSVTYTALAGRFFITGSTWEALGSQAGSTITGIEKQAIDGKVIMISLHHVEWRCLRVSIRQKGRDGGNSEWGPSEYSFSTLAYTRMTGGAC